MGHPFLGARIAKEETILDPQIWRFPVTIRATGRTAGRPASLALQYIGHAVRHAIFPHMYARFCLFLFSLFSLLFALAL